jgi:hypothetical protein
MSSQNAQWKQQYEGKLRATQGSCIIHVSRTLTLKKIKFSVSETMKITRSRDHYTTFGSTTVVPRDRGTFYFTRTRSSDIRRDSNRSHDDTATHAHPILLTKSLATLKAASACSRTRFDSAFFSTSSSCTCPFCPPSPSSSLKSTKSLILTGLSSGATTTSDHLSWSLSENFSLSGLRLVCWVVTGGQRFGGIVRKCSRENSSKIM